MTGQPGAQITFAFIHIRLELFPESVAAAIVVATVFNGVTFGISLSKIVTRTLILLHAFALKHKTMTRS